MAATAGLFSRNGRQNRSHGTSAWVQCMENALKKGGGLKIGHTPHAEPSQGMAPCPCILAQGLISVMLLQPPCCYSQAVTATVSG